MINAASKGEGLWEEISTMSNPRFCSIVTFVERRDAISSTSRSLGLSLVSLEGVCTRTLKLSIWLRALKLSLRAVEAISRTL